MMWLLIVCFFLSVITFSLLRIAFALEKLSVNLPDAVERLKPNQSARFPL